jgi:N-acetylneuraminate synthase
MFEPLRPAPIDSIPPYEIEKIIGKVLVKDLCLGEEINWGDIQ